MEEQLRGQAVASLMAGDKMMVMSWNDTLAATLLDQGRHDEAVAIFEAILKYRRRELPENHPGIGAA